MRIGMMMMIMPMMMAVLSMMMVVIIMVMVMRMQGSPRQIVKFAKLFLTTGSIAIAVAWTIFKTTTNAFNMMMMTFLRQPHLIFKTKNLFTVFAHLTVHHRHAIHNLVNPVPESLKHQ